MARRKMNMSDNQGQFECECRQPAQYGSAPRQGCEHCDGTGYTNDSARRKSWGDDPAGDDD